MVALHKGNPQIPKCALDTSSGYDSGAYLGGVTMGEKHLTSEVKVFIDGYEITNANFFLPEVQVVEVDSEESLKFLKSRFDFSGTITLSPKTVRRLKWMFRKLWFKQWWKDFIAKVQGWFKVGT